MAPTSSGMLVAWEDEMGVRWARIAQGKSSKPVMVAMKSKHPAIGQHADGSVLVAYAEGAGWNQGGTLHWRRYGSDGQTLAESQQSADVPVWSTPTMVADETGFLVWY